MWCQLHGENRTEAIPKTSDIFNVILRAWLWYKNFFSSNFRHGYLAFHFVISYLLSKSEFTVPLKNDPLTGEK